MKEPQKAHEYEEQWEIILNRIKDSIECILYRLDEVAINDDFKIIGYAGIEITNLINMYKSLKELHEKYATDAEIQEYETHLQESIKNQLENLFK